MIDSLQHIVSTNYKLIYIYICEYNIYICVNEFIKFLSFQFLSKTTYISRINIS